MNTTRPTHSSLPPHGHGARYRVRWDNVLIVGLAIAAVAVLLPSVNSFATRITGLDAARSDRHRPAPRQSQRRLHDIDPDGSLSEPRTLEEAMRIVQRARSAMRAGDFEQARTLLATIGNEFADTSGASELRDENATRQQQYEAFTQDALQQATEGKWREAHALLRQASDIAPLSDELERTKAQAVRNLAVDASLDQARTQLSTGNRDAARATAQKGFERYGDSRFTKLLAEIEAAAARPPAHTRQSQQSSSTAPPSVGGSTPAPTPSPGTIAPGGGGHASMGDMDHGSMAGMDHGSMPGMDGGQMQAAANLLTQLQVTLGSQLGNSAGALGGGDLGSEL